MGAFKGQSTQIEQGKVLADILLGAARVMQVARPAGRDWWNAPDMELASKVHNQAGAVASKALGIADLYLKHIFAITEED